MKLVNDRYLLIKKLETPYDFNIYYSKDKFKNQSVQVRLIDDDKFNEKYQSNYQKLNLVEHPYLIKYYNFENIWFVDGQISHTNYNALVSEYFEHDLDDFIKDGKDQKKIVNYLNQFFTAFFYLFKNNIYIDSINLNLIKIFDNKIKIDLINADIKDQNSADDLLNLIDCVVDNIEKKLDIEEKNLQNYLNILKNNKKENILNLLNTLESENFYKLDKFNYIFLKEKWTSKEVGLDIHLNILKDLYYYQAKRNSKICFMFFGPEDSQKSILIEDFLNYLKFEKYLKLEIIMQNFHDFLKYLFDCLKHYKLREDLNKKIKSLFQKYYDTLDDSFLLKLQDTLIKLLFDFSLTKKVVLHIKNIVGIDDRIIKFINLILHISMEGNIVLIFDGGIEKSRFNVFYKKPKFVLVTKEYPKLEEAEKKKILENILLKDCNYGDILELIDKYDLDNAYSIVNFVENIYENNYLKLDTINSEVTIKYEEIDKNRDEILQNDVLVKCIQYLREEEKELLWYLANTHTLLTLKDFVNLLDMERDEVLEYLGTLRIHAYVEEIWEDESNPYYKIVNEDVKKYFQNIENDISRKYRRNFIKFLNRNNENPKFLVNLIMLLYEEDYKYTAVYYLFNLVKNFVLISEDYKKLFKIAEKLLDFPTSTNLRWKIRWAYLNILKMLDEKEKLSSYLDRLFEEYSENPSKTHDIENWYVIAYYYLNYYDGEKVNVNKIKQILNVINKSEDANKKQYLGKILQFFIVENNEQKKRLTDEILKLKDTGLSLTIEMNAKFFVFKYIFDEGDYDKIESYEEELVEYFEKYDNGEFDVGKIIKAFYLRMGNFKLDEGDAEKALDYYNRAMVYAKQNRDYKFIIKLQNNIAAAKYYIGENDKEIISELKKAVSLGREIGEHENIVVAQANLSDYNAMNFYYKEAYRYIQNALEHVDKEKHKTDYYIVLGQYIELLLSLGAYDKADEIRNEYKKVTEEKQSWYYVVSNDLMAGKIEFYKENFDKSQKYLEEYLQKLKQHHLFNYDYVKATLFLIDINLNKGKKTKARNLYNEVKDIIRENKIDLGDIELEIYDVYFIQNLQNKIEKLENILNRNKRKKRNKNILKVLILLSECYEEKEFRYRLYEIYSEILFFEQQIKTNFPKKFVQNYQQNFYIKKIKKRKKALSSHINIPLSEINFNQITDKWLKYYKNNITNFFNINMRKLINNWVYSLSKSEELKKLVLRYIMDISNADRAAIFVKNYENEYRPVQVIENKNIYEKDEFKYNLLNSKIKNVNKLFVKSYDSFSSEIVKAGIFPIVHHSFSFRIKEEEERRMDFNTLNEFFEAIIYVDTKNYCNYLNEDLNEYIFPIVQYLNLLFNFEEVQEDIIRCPLTNVFTRSYFLKELEEVVNKRKSNKTIGLLIIDVDDLKVINRKYGNEIGDKVLETIAGILTKNRRAYDIIGRYMGDEFIVSFMNISKNELYEKAEIIKDKIDKNNLFSKYEVDVSIGLSFIPDHGEKVELVISKAIASMIKAKSKKSKIALWEDNYGLYRGKHDILAGIINKDISSSERIIRNITEIIMMAPSSFKDFSSEVETILSRLFKYKYSYIKIKCGNDEFIHRDNEIQIINENLKNSRKKNDSLISLNWNYENNEDELYTDLVRKRDYNNIELTIYLSSSMEEYEYNHNDANLLNIISKILVGHLFYMYYKKK
ncbi:MAG: GGDEF domain-containing protein [Candidatus Mcinerneyibacterium aminivorans]|uniref:GGDEF domain-containing protein n=1 Tax=Candidatus Mcinerneyibacterium aminivorans TaxID=2703815 RepID=A0A5D0MJJ5_9BACT|nr:MAG: GGDEF domain-containing protein [Candidatus Mcinerneyibacterium aminivorans]